VEQLRLAEQGLGLFEDHMAFVRSLAFDLNVDETTLILLLVIALFSPDRDRLSDRELIAAQQERYTQTHHATTHVAIGRIAAQQERCVFSPAVGLAQRCTFLGLR